MAEQMRILYVALTRAMEKLIITDVRRDAETPDIPAPDRRSVLGVRTLMEWIRMALNAEEHVVYTKKSLTTGDLSENILKDTARASAGFEALYAADLPVSHIDVVRPFDLCRDSLALDVVCDSERHCLRNDELLLCQNVRRLEQY